jgi:hypothetical protein
VARATGPLAPQGWLTLVLYPMPVIWLVPAAIVMIRRLGRSDHGMSGAGSLFANGYASPDHRAGA